MELSRILTVQALCVFSWIMAMLLMYQLMWIQLYKHSTKTYKFSTNHSYQIKKKIKLQAPLSVSEC